ELACAADLVPGIPGDPVQVYVRDATEPFDFSRQAPDGFDVITCISGVMVFEGLGTFLKNCRNNLANDGVLVLTNDNSITIRDRLSFLLSGRVRRYRLFMEAGEECWNYISLGALLIKLEENGFRLERIKYVSVFPEDWIWFPLIPVVYFLQLAVLFRPGRYSLTERLALIPPAALICRHYILVCSKLPAGEFTR
ncbi:MAG: hypothetical protein RL120_14605, partial [Gammaproteobacteria bacterium]